MLKWIFRKLLKKYKENTYLNDAQKNILVFSFFRFSFTFLFLFLFTFFVCISFFLSISFCPCSLHHLSTVLALFNLRWFYNKISLLFYLSFSLCVFVFSSFLPGYLFISRSFYLPHFSYIFIISSCFSLFLLFDIEE